MKILENKLSVVIVNYNAGDYLYNCIKSLHEAKKELDLDVWVVDNASYDDSIKKIKLDFNFVHLIENQENFGFGKANNQAFKEITTENILLLNPDCYVSAKTLQYMLGFMQSKQDVGAASCKVEKSDGSIDWASHRGFPTPWASFLYFGFGDDSLYHLTNKNLQEVHEVDSISGAFFMTKKSVLEKLNPPGFDEDYFLYAEDIDLCFRIKQLGYKIMYVPQVSVLHHKGISSGIKKHSQEVSTAILASKQRALDSFYETMKIFYKKHLANSYPFFINWLVYAGINFKWMLAKRKMSV